MSSHEAAKLVSDIQGQMAVEFLALEEGEILLCQALEALNEAMSWEDLLKTMQLEADLLQK